MSITLTYQGNVQINANTRTECIGDTIRFWQTTPISVLGNVQVGTNTFEEFVGDTRRIWLPGGVVYRGTVLVELNNSLEFTADTKRIWQAGGIVFIGCIQIGTNINDAFLADTFRIKGVTLEKGLQLVPLRRQVLQPPGVPWLQGEVTTAAWCWKLTLRDGTVFGFTNHDEDIPLGGVTYEASTGFVPTAVETSNNMAVDNLDVEGFLDSNRIKAEDIAVGRFDFAKVEVFLCNWMNTKDPLLVIRKGTTGQIKTGKYGFQAEVRGLLDAYQQSAGTVYQKSCRAKLGDLRCKVQLSSLAASGQVTQTNQDGTINTNLSQSKGYFDYGVLTFTTGANSGCQYEIKTFDDGVLTLFLPTTFSVAVGDSFTITPGCDGNFSTCRTKFNNGMNFRGEPHIPGNDYQSSYPGQGSSNTVSEGSHVRRG